MVQSVNVDTVYYVKAEEEKCNHGRTWGYTTTCGPIISRNYLCKCTLAALGAWKATSGLEGHYR